MKLRYRPRHLKPHPRKRGPMVLGTATAVWFGSSARADAAVHVVRRGETLSAIAARYSTSVSRLAAANRLADPNLILAGQRLRVPGRARTISVHVVRPGETLSSIGARYGVSPARLARANRVSDPNFIVAGAKLRVPGGGHTSAGSSASWSTERALEQHAVSHGLEPALVKAVAWHESGWRQSARSSAGAIGIMQVMPATARYVNQTMSGHRLRVRRAGDNIHLGVMYLRHMLQIMPSEAKALAAYYSGPGAVKRRLNEGQRAYVRTVRALKARFR